MPVFILPARLPLLAMLTFVVSLVPCTIRAESLPFDEACAIPGPGTAVAPPPATQEDLLVTSRKLGWVGNQLLQKGRFDEASLHLRDGFNVLMSMEEPPPVEVARLANILGFTYTMLDEPLNARPAFDLALEYLPRTDPDLAPKRAPVLLNYAELLLRNGQWNEARTRLDEALALQEAHDVPEAKRAPVYITQGELALGSGMPDEAADWLERADRAMAGDPDADPRHRIALLTALRESYQLLGRSEDELRAGQRILELQAAITKPAESP